MGTSLGDVVLARPHCWLYAEFLQARVLLLLLLPQVIKVYWADEHPRFPEGGKMSQYLESLAIGDTIDVKGPTGHVHYLGRGQYTLDGEAHRTSHISMIAGGTGITPMYQVGPKCFSWGR
jgi:hypothetical protein